jgi:ketosteroid isomerase-like protein
MKRILLVLAVLIAASSITPGQKTDPRLQNRTTTNDEETLKQLINEWADAVVHADLAKLERIEDDNFRGSAEGLSFNKKMFLSALRSGQVKVAAWTMDEMKVSVRGNMAMAKGRSTLSNATYMGKDFSGQYEWEDRFTKQRDGNWRAVSSQSKRVRQ